MTFPLNKPCDLAGDAETLAPYYAQVDRVPDVLAGQHPIRRWEYAMALRAIEHWAMAKALPDVVRAAKLQAATKSCVTVVVPALEICDVGGAGSNFWRVLNALTPTPIVLIDPAAPTPDGKPGVSHYETRITVRGTVEEFAATRRHDHFDILTCISVIEHVPDLRPFLRACRMLLKPGGLLFLTCDYWNAEGPDVAHFHWMRERIYNAEAIGKLLHSLRELGYKGVGTTNWSYPGHQVYDYSVASLAVVKK